MLNEEIINQLLEEIEDDILTLDSEIQILRRNGQISDWYYSDKMINQLIMLSQMKDDKANKAIVKELLDRYMIVRNNLSITTVRECINELKHPKYN